MLKWLASLFRKPEQPAAPRREPVTRRDPVPPAAAPEAQATRSAPPDGGPGEASVEFYRRLSADEREPLDLQELAPDDRVFLSGILKRLRENRLEVPVLPRAALEISRLLADPNSDAGKFAQVLTADPALSVDVLRVANSAYYGFASTVTNIRDAVVRIGFSQLRGLVIVTHLHGKVMQGGCFQGEAAWLSTLSTALAHLAQQLAGSLDLEKDTAFTRGMLRHVQHFVIMGTVGEVSRDHKRRMRPSAEALHEAFARFGPKVRELAGKMWGLGDLLGSHEDDPLEQIYAQLERALIADWTGEPGPLEVGGVEPAALEAALVNVRRRAFQNGRSP